MKFGVIKLRHTSTGHDTGLVANCHRTHRRQDQWNEHGPVRMSSLGCGAARLGSVAIADGHWCLLVRCRPTHADHLERWRNQTQSDLMW